MGIKLINIGFGNIVSANRLVAIVSPESAPIKRIIQEARDRGMLIDATYGRRTRAVIITDSDHVILSAVHNRGLLIVISGPSGAGKGTICKALLEKIDDLFISVSATTRSPREGEVDGVNYHFLTKEDFISKVERNDFLEYAEVHGNMYGTPKFKVEEMLEQGKNVILEIDIQGALKVKENFSEGVFIFILPPSMEELKQRIIKRGSETQESLMTRFKNAYQEINYVSKYNYAVVNDEVDTAVEKIEGIIVAEKCRVDRIKDTILDSKEGVIHEQLYD